MRLAYIISAYKYPDQLKRLVHRLAAESTSFLVHVDKKTDERIYREMVDGLESLPSVRFLKRYRCDWGGFGHVAATLEGISELFRTDTSFDYAVLLTGQDYPIKSTGQIRAFLEQHNGTAFLEFFPLPTEAWRNRGAIGGMDRIEAWHWRICGRHWRLPPDHRFPPRRRFPKGFRPFGGSSYWCLPRECVRYIYELTTENRTFTTFFKYVDVPDEIFFQTILLNSPLRERVISDDLRYIDWKDGEGGSPAILRRSDFHQLMVSAKLFARKFDLRVDAEVLDLIDTEILGVPSRSSAAGDAGFRNG